MFLRNAFRKADSGLEFVLQHGITALVVQHSSAAMGIVVAFSITVAALEFALEVLVPASLARRLRSTCVAVATTFSDACVATEARAREDDRCFSA